MKWKEAEAAGLAGGLDLPHEGKGTVRSNSQAVKTSKRAVVFKFTEMKKKTKVEETRGWEGREAK